MLSANWNAPMPPEASGLFRQTHRKGCRYTIRVFFGWEKPCVEQLQAGYRRGQGNLWGRHFKTCAFHVATDRQLKRRRSAGNSTFST